VIVSKTADDFRTISSTAYRKRGEIGEFRIDEGEKWRKIEDQTKKYLMN